MDRERERTETMEDKTYIGKVKIYGTLGPACEDPETLKAMFREGMDGIRLNLSHMTLEEAAGRIGACQSAAGECSITPELLIDMQGPELRIGELEDPIELTTGSVIGIDRIPFPKAVKEALARWGNGQEILLDDGKILMRTESPEDGQERSPCASPGCVDQASVDRPRIDQTCVDQLRIIRGGVLQSRKSIALPGCHISPPAMTEKDRRQIALAKKYGVTAVMQPFVRGKDDLMEVRSALQQAGCEGIRLLAKIENREGIERLEELLPHCDEIVIARGDLGNAMDLWQLPAAQKHIAECCRKAGKPFMVVTQMLDSMTHRPVPTRAEVSDIFNAVLDGAAAVMVTGETAAGQHPVPVIRYLARTVREAEAYMQTNIRKDF